jgi:hypothetical protein
MQTATLAKRSLSGLAGTAIFFPILYFSYTVGRGMYYDYILFPKLKADDHYIAPTRWQDFTFLAAFWTVVLVLAFVSYRLIRFALKPKVRLAPSMRRPVSVKHGFVLVLLFLE